MKHPALLAPAIWLGIALAWASAQQSPPEVDFSSEIRPLLSDKCFHCHGPDDSDRQAELRLDLREDAARVLPSEQEPESEFWRRITASDPDVRMPPPHAKNELTEQEIELLGRWLRSGAPYQSHWSFAPIASPPLPTLSAESAAWAENPIDLFVRRRLEALGAEPSPAAARAQWLRRVSFDLTGLPPTTDELQAFLDDPRPDAEHRVVDRLLASPRFGERLAADWLDVARYSDTYGYQVDRERFVWPWRDWVIEAFNQGKPYDEFITEQLAGDLLPQPTQQQVLATTFNRLHPQKVEGGSVPEEFRVEYVADRNHTFASAFLGLTLECCRCHDHKYDPITQREYYQLFAFFNNIDEAGLYSYFTSSVPTPTLMLADASRQEELDRLRLEIEQAEERMRELTAEQAAAYRRWLAERPPHPWVRGAIAALDFEQTPIGANRRVPGVTGQAVQLTGDDAVGVGVGNFARWQPFSVSLWLQTPDVKERAVVFHRSRAWTDAGSRGYEMLLDEGRLHVALIHFWPGNAIAIRTQEPLSVGEWRHVLMTYDGSGRADGLRLYLEGRLAETEVVRDNLYKAIQGGGGDTIAIGERFRDRGFAGGRVDEFVVYDRRLTDLEAAQVFNGRALAEAIAAAERDQASEVSAADPLVRYYLETVDEVFAEQRRSVQELRERRCRLQDSTTEIMVMREMDSPRPTHLLQRGAYDAPGEEVAANTPQTLPPLREHAPRNRLGLAQWLTSPEQPLTARVTVNRLWSLCFGRGLVATPEDFGSQGAAPSHPELLDWLAADFRDHGWDVKRTLKQIVLSATYRQSSVPGADATTEQRSTWAKWVQQDPDNRWLSRGPSHQLSAEMLRDNALAVSGLLSRRVGGPPAKPYELAASFKPITPDQGEGLYRRSLYTYWKRTAPAPVMMTLDAATREVCTVRRERTASPLQSLVLLNDPQLVEAARVLAEALVRRHGFADEALIEDAFLRTTSRRPTAAEADVLLRLLRSQRSHFAQFPEQATQWLSNGEAPRDATLSAPQAAAAAVVASTLFNYDACITKR